MPRFIVNPNPPAQQKEPSEITIRVENGKVIMEVPLKVEPSSTGRSMLLYSSHGYNNSDNTAGPEIQELVGTPFEGGTIGFSGNIYVTRRK